MKVSKRMIVVGAIALAAAMSFSACVAPVAAPVTEADSGADAMVSDWPGNRCRSCQ